MNDIKRIGGWSAVLFGISILAAYALFIPTFTAMPAEAMQPENFAARLAAIGGLGSIRRSALTVAFALEVTAGVFLYPALLAVYSVTKEKSQSRATLAVIMASVGSLFLILSFISGFSLLQQSDGFTSATEVVQAARVTTSAYTERLSLLLERAFWLFFAWSVALWFDLTRDPLFPRWLAWVNLAAGVVGVIGTVGGLILAPLEMILPLGLLLLTVWFIGLGFRLLKIEMSG